MQFTVYIGDFKCSFEKLDNEFINKKELDIIHVGDCIEIIVSLDNKKVQKWNKSKFAKIKENLKKSWWLAYISYLCLCYKNNL